MARKITETKLLVLAISEVPCRANSQHSLLRQQKNMCIKISSGFQAHRPSALLRTDGRPTRQGTTKQNVQRHLERERERSAARCADRLLYGIGMYIAGFGHRRHRRHQHHQFCMLRRVYSSQLFFSFSPVHFDSVYYAMHVLCIDHLCCACICAIKNGNPLVHICIMYMYMYIYIHQGMVEFIVKQHFEWTATADEKMKKTTKQKKPQQQHGNIFHEGYNKIYYIHFIYIIQHNEWKSCYARQKA